MIDVAFIAAASVFSASRLKSSFATPLPQSQTARTDAFLVKRCATGPAYTTLSVTSMLPRVALE